LYRVHMDMGMDIDMGHGHGMSDARAGSTLGLRRVPAFDER